MLFTCSTAFRAFTLYLPTLDREVECEYVDLPEPVQAPGCTPIRIEDLLDQVRNRKIDEYKWVLFHFNRTPLAIGIFLNSWEDFEPALLKAIREHPFYKQIATPPVHPVGLLIKEDEPLTELGAKCVAWLDKQPLDSILLVSLGSGGTLTNAQPTDGSASGSFFKVDGDVNDPKAYLPEGFIERTKGVGLVVPSWAPQVAVLHHPSTGVFLSHCGWNSILESITYGVPMIAWPLYAEQRMNAAMLVEEVGVAVKPMVGEGTGVVEREEIERMVRMVMEGEEGKTTRGRAKELEHSASQGLNFGGSSYKSLFCVVKEWTTSDQI